MKEFLGYISSMSEGAVVLRLILATLMGSIVGWERELKHHSAGVKTMTLVSLGSAVATIVNIYMAAMPGFEADVSRIPASVVSGIGFLGAGTILVTGKNQIKGLTTAATLWVTACMGMAVGAGYLIVGVTCLVLILGANILLLHFVYVIEDNSKFLSIYLEINKDKGVKELLKELEQKQIKLNRIRKAPETTLKSGDAAVVIDIIMTEKRPHRDIVNELNELSYITYAEEV